jgi:hypothetical protein
MTEERGYILRQTNSRGEDEYFPISVFTIDEYRCGLRAGERLRLHRALPGDDEHLLPDDAAHEIGGVWTVLTGSPQDPDALWLSQSDGGLHSWSDDESIFEYFDKLAGV